MCFRAGIAITVDPGVPETDHREDHVAAWSSRRMVTMMTKRGTMQDPAPKTQRPRRPQAHEPIEPKSDEFVPVTAPDILGGVISAYLYQGHIHWSLDGNPVPADAVPIYMKADRS